MLRKHWTHRSNVVVIITIVTVSLPMVMAEERPPKAIQLLLKTHMSSGEQSLALVCGTVGDTSLMVPLVSVSHSMRLSWPCHLDTAENSLRRESQLRDHLDQIGL